jgi:hypothetical protein
VKRKKTPLPIKTVIFQTVRFLGIVFGIFLLTASLLDILGLLPYSQKNPILFLRIKNAILPLIYGLLFLMPYRKIKEKYQFYLLFGLFLLIFMWYLRFWLLGILAFIQSGEDILILMISIFMIFITLSNLVLMYASYKKNKPQRK